MRKGAKDFGHQRMIKLIKISFNVFEASMSKSMQMLFLGFFLLLVLFPCSVMFVSWLGFH